MDQFTNLVFLMIINKLDSNYQLMVLHGVLYSLRECEGDEDCPLILKNKRYLRLFLTISLRELWDYLTVLANYWMFVLNILELLKSAVSIRNK